MTIYPAHRPQRKTTSHKSINSRTIFVTAPGGVLFTIDPQHADPCAERLTRFIPDYACSHVTAGDYWIVTEQYAETARKILLLTTGTMLRLWAPSYAAALGRLAHHGRVTAALRQTDRGAA
jgi:hypothetical protein